MKYEITRMRGAFDTVAAEHITVKRADAANRHLRRMVRDMVAANGLLDRAAGADLICEVERYEYTAPDRGTFVLDRWKLPNGAGEVIIYAGR